MTSPILPYKSDMLRIDVDPGRQVIIDSPPIGFLRAIKVKSNLSAVIVILFFICCLALPSLAVFLAYFRFHQHDVLPALFLVPFVTAAIALIFSAFIAYRAAVHFTLIATPDTLIIDKRSFSEPTRLVIARDTIDLLGACYTKGEETDPSRMAFSLHIRRKRYDMDDIFLEHLSHKDVQNISDHLCAMLNIVPAPPDPRR